MTDADCPDCGHDYIPMHPTENICGIPIDEQLAPLIRICWRLGIHTEECCQEAGSSFVGAYIAFPTLPDATRFVTLLAAANPAYAQDFLELNEFEGEHGFRVDLSYQGSLDDPALPLLVPRVTVEFPTELIGELTANVAAYLVATASRAYQLELELFNTADR